MIHENPLKLYLVNDRIFSSASAGLNPKSPVCMGKPAVSYRQIFYSSGHLAANGNRAMPVPHAALDNGNILRRSTVFGTHINFS